MFKCIFNLSGSTGTLILSGELTIESATELKHSLNESLNQVNCLIIDHKSVDNFDLSYLQLLISLNKTAENSGKTLDFCGQHPKKFIDLLENSGSSEFVWLNTDKNIELH